MSPERQGRRFLASGQPRPLRLRGNMPRCHSKAARRNPRVSKPHERFKNTFATVLRDERGPDTGCSRKTRNAVGSHRRDAQYIPTPMEPDVRRPTRSTHANRSSAETSFRSGPGHPATVIVLLEMPQDDNRVTGREASARAISEEAPVYPRLHRSFNTLLRAVLGLTLPVPIQGRNIIPQIFESSSLVHICDNDCELA